MFVFRRPQCFTCANFLLPPPLCQAVRIRIWHTVTQIPLYLYRVMLPPLRSFGIDIMQLCSYMSRSMILFLYSTTSRGIPNGQPPSILSRTRNSSLSSNESPTIEGARKMVAQPTRVKRASFARHRTITWSHYLTRHHYWHCGCLQSKHSESPRPAYVLSVQ